VPPLEVQEVADAGALSHAAAELIASASVAGVTSSGRFTLALSGGNTPRALYRLLAAQYGALPWSSTFLFFGDERCVPPTDPDSNYRMANESLLSGIPGLAERTARIEGEREPSEAAKRYDDVLHKAFKDGTTFDMALFGIGEDGHTASLFPGSPALDERIRWAVATEAPPTMKTRQRVTLTYPVLNNTRLVVFLCAGADKHRILTEVLAAAGNPEAAYPASRLRAANRLLYIVDRAALRGP
jgi:6-phosphogluconolactonase